LSIALKEARENQYWLDLLHATEYIDDVSFKSMNDDCNKIIGTLVKIIKTTKNKFEKDDKS
jgi:four helix bundle protein